MTYETNETELIFSARQHSICLCLARYAIVHPSVGPSVTRMDQSKTVEVRIMRFLPYGNPIPLVCVGHPEIQTGSPERGR